MYSVLYLRRMTIFLVAMVCISSLTGCAQFLPVPGGDDTTNEKYYEGEEDLMAALKRLQVGMSKERAFSILMRKEDDFKKLDRAGILHALYGGSDVELQQGMSAHGMSTQFLASLAGYSFRFQVVESEHGFTSPIRVRTREEGYDYSVSLIFQNDILVEEPILSGGDINKTSSGTIFDFISPRFVLDYAL